MAAKKETTITITVHGIEERITLDGTFEPKPPKERKRVDDPRIRTEADRTFLDTIDPVVVEYDDATAAAVGRHFLATYRSTFDVHDHRDVRFEAQQAEVVAANERAEAARNA